jgi:hypothetical protein
MKKFLIALLSLVAVSFATTVVTSSGVNYENLGIVATISSVSNYDTIVTTDSVTLTSTFVPNRGDEVMLVHSPFVASGDSVNLIVNIDVLGIDGSVLYRIPADTLVAESEIPVSLPLLGGAKYRIKLKGITGNSTVILNKIYLVARRALTITKPWN